jgi:hypothetical protein
MCEMKNVNYATYTVDMMRDFAKPKCKFDEIGEFLDAILVAAKNGRIFAKFPDLTLKEINLLNELGYTVVERITDCGYDTYFHVSWARETR